MTNEELLEEVKKIKTFSKFHDKVEAILKNNNYYLPTSVSADEATDAERSKAFTILYLLSRFPGINLENVENFIIDDSSDHKIDAAYVTHGNHIYIYQTKYYECEVPTDELSDMNTLWSNIRRSKLGFNVFGDANKETTDKFVNPILPHIGEGGYTTHLVILTATGFSKEGEEKLTKLKENISSYSEINNIQLDIVCMDNIKNLLNIKD